MPTKYKRIPTTTKQKVHEIARPDFVQVRWREPGFLKRRNFEAATSTLMEFMDLLGTSSAIANASIICVFVGFELSSIDNEPDTWLLLAGLEQNIWALYRRRHKINCFGNDYMDNEESHIFIQLRTYVLIYNSLLIDCNDRFPKKRSAFNIMMSMFIGILTALVKPS